MHGIINKQTNKPKKYIKIYKKYKKLKRNATCRMMNIFHKKDLTCASVHSQNFFALPVPPSSSVFAACSRSGRSGPKRPHGMTIHALLAHFSCLDEKRRTPGSVVIGRNIWRETSEQLCIRAVNWGIQELIQNGGLPPDHMTLELGFEVSRIKRLQRSAYSTLQRDTRAHAPH